MLPALSQPTSVGRLKLEPGVPDPGAAACGPPRPPPAAGGGGGAPRPSGAPPRAPAAGPPAPGGAGGGPKTPEPIVPAGPGEAPGRTLMVSGLRPRTSATRPSASNFTTWLAPMSIVQMLSCGSTRMPYAALNP